MSDTQIPRPVLRWRRIELDGDVGARACAEVLATLRGVPGIRHADLDPDHTLRLQYALDETCLAEIEQWLDEHGVPLNRPRYYAFAREAVYRVEADIQTRLAHLDGGRATRLPAGGAGNPSGCVALQRFEPVLPAPTTALVP